MSSTQVVCVFHYGFPLQRIVACVYTVTIPSGPCSLAHRRRALNTSQHPMSLPTNRFAYVACVLHGYQVQSSYCYSSMPNNPTTFQTLGSPLPTMPPSTSFPIFKLQGPTP